MSGFFSTVFGVRRAPEKIQRPHCYTFQIGIFNNDAVCLSPNKQRQPVRMFLVQADLLNGGVVNIGDASVSLINGIQLDPGRAIQFSVSNDDLAGGMFSTPTNFTEGRGQQNKAEEDIYLDLADFYVAGDAALQRVRVFWTTVVS